MKFVEFNAVDDIDQDQWRTLWEQCTDATVFQSREWMRAWTSVFAPSSDDVKLITAWEGERLVGIAPFARSSRNVLDGKGEWSLLGDDYSDYQVFLAWDDSPRIVEALLDAVHTCVPYASKLALRDIPQHSILGMVLAQRSSQPGAMLTAEEFTSCPTLRIQGNELGVRRVLGKSSLRRCERGLRKLGQVTVDHHSRSAEIKDLLPGLFAQHIRRWSDTPHPSLFLKPDNQRFFELAAESMEEGTLLYSTVQVDARVVAQHFGLKSKNSLIWYKPAFDIDFRQHSPGEMLLESLIRYARDHEFEEFDFTRGDETFKSRFASLVSYNRSFLWHRDRLSSWRRNAVQAKARLRRFLIGADLTPEHLGGIALAPGGLSRALVLDLSSKASSDFALSLASHGVEVHVAGSSPPPDGSGLKYIQQPEESDAVAFVGWLDHLCREQQYSLIVPAAAFSASSLAALPQSHALRSRCLLAVDEPRAMNLSRTTRAITAIPTGRTSDSDDPVRNVCVLALYVHGRMVDYYVDQHVDRRTAMRIQCAAKRALDAAKWHGPATVYGELTATDEIVLTKVEPFFAQSLDAALRAGRQFPLFMWRAITGRRCEPH